MGFRYVCDSSSATLPPVFRGCGRGTVRNQKSHRRRGVVGESCTTADPDSLTRFDRFALSPVVATSVSLLPTVRPRPQLRQRRRDLVGCRVVEDVLQPARFDRLRVGVPPLAERLDLGDDRRIGVGHVSVLRTISAAGVP